MSPDAGNFAKNNNQPTVNFNKQQKIGLSVLVIFILAVFVMWYLELQKNITYPLYGGMNPKDLAEKLSNQTVTVDQNKDTDKDGLSDYQEVNLYRTSQFMADSDGDGLTDKQEIDAKTDPNCPEGQTCNNILDNTTNLPTELTNNSSSTGQDSQLSLDLLNQLGQASPSNQLGSAGLTQDKTSALKNAFGENPDPSILRQKFLEVSDKEEDKQLINNMTNDELLQVYQAMISNN